MELSYKAIKFVMFNLLLLISNVSPLSFGVTCSMHFLQTMTYTQHFKCILIVVFSSSARGSK